MRSDSSRSVVFTAVYGTLALAPRGRREAPPLRGPGTPPPRFGTLDIAKRFKGGRDGASGKFLQDKVIGEMGMFPIELDHWLIYLKVEQNFL